MAAWHHCLQPFFSFVQKRLFGYVPVIYTALCDVLQSNVLLAAASSGHSQATDLLCRLYCDSRQAGAAAVDPDLLGAAYQAAVAQLEGCSTGDSFSHTTIAAARRRSQTRLFLG